MHAFDAHLINLIAGLKEEGLYKTERLIETSQQAEISVHGHEVINLCANNYLGLANHPVLVSEAQNALDKFGYGMASVRFICGTQTPHKALEKAISNFLEKEDTILYSSCFDANGGLFETLLSEEDAIVSDALNHASIIDGIRLCKAKRFRYANNDMAALKASLEEAKAAGARFILVATDGVFSMDGTIANLPAIVELARQFNAMVMVDDSHAVGFMGKHGRGTPEHFGLQNEIDILTGTLGKALGGASGGYISARQPVIDWLRQRSRPYLFSNTLAPVIAQASIAALRLLEEEPALIERVHANARHFRKHMSALGFSLLPGEHPIIPVMLQDAKLAVEMASRLLKLGVYVIGFSYPVVPKGQARIRTQMSSAHTIEQLDRAISAFAEVGRDLGVIAH